MGPHVSFNFEVINTINIDFGGELGILKNI